MVRQLINQPKVTYSLQMHKQGKMVRQVIVAQSTKGHIQSVHKQDGIVRQIIHAHSTKDHIQSENAQTRQDGQTNHQSTKDHIHPGNVQTRQDSQTDHSYSINKRSHTAWKCPNEMGWSDRSFMLNQKKGHIQSENVQTRQDGQVIHVQ